MSMEWFTKWFTKQQPKHKHRWHCIHTARDHRTVYHTYECLDCRYKECEMVYSANDGTIGGGLIRKRFAYKEPVDN